MSGILEAMLRALPVVGAGVAKAPEFVALWYQVAGLLDAESEAEALAALDDVHADNDAGHRRLQERLRAIGRG